MDFYLNNKSSSISHNSHLGVCSSKNETITGRIFFYIYIALYIVLPSYTKLLGNPVYRLLSIATFLIVFFLNFRKITYIGKTFLFVFFAYSITQCASFLFNQEIDRVFVFVIEFMLPFSTICFVFRHDRKAINHSISIVLCISFILCIFGIIEEFTQFNVFSLIENFEFENPHMNSGSSFRWDVYRIEQGFSTALTYALFIVLCFGLSFYRWKTTKRIRYFILMLLEIINLVLTVSRGIIVLFCFELVLLVIFTRRKNNLVFNLLTTLFLAFGIVFIISMPQLSGLFEKIFGSTFSMLFRGSDAAFGDQSLEMRSGFQGYAISLLSEPSVFLFGVGEYGLRELTTIDNDWLLELVTYGIFGLLSFVGLFAFGLIRNLLILRKKDLTNDSKMFAICAIFTLGSYALSLFTVAQMEEVKMFYVFLGTCAYFPFSKAKTTYLW